jgi:soluble lytic murein transglycosylase-like protein
MRSCPSPWPRLVILIALSVLGATFTRYAQADIFGAVGNDGTIILTNIPGNAGLTVIVGGETPPRHGTKPQDAAKSDGIELTRFADIIDEASRNFRIQPELLRAVIAVESQYNPNAVSKRGARGLMQLMPETARRFSGGDLFNPRVNVLAGAGYLRFLLDLFKDDIELALAAYNAGENAVIRAGNRIPSFPETRVYVPRVMARYRSLLAPS